VKENENPKLDSNVGFYPLECADDAQN
jgi:hypothetical protein